MTRPPTVLDTPTTKSGRPRRLKRPIRRRLGPALAFLSLGAAGMVVVVGLAIGAYIFQSAYNVSHQKSPSEAADSFLDALLNRRNLDITENYMCDSPQLRKKASETIDSLHKYQTDGNGHFITYHWDISVRNETDAHATVAARMQIRTTIAESTQVLPIQVWALDMANRSGWKVCGMTTPE